MLVIANPQVPVAVISVEDLSAIYLIQRTSWNNGTPMAPVNREASSQARGAFSEAIFNRSPTELSEYWNRLRFQGKIPPLVQTSDQAVLGFVRTVPGAIGYVEATQAPAGVKVLLKLP
jgi:ABC-type phosphate transport system substrate-binding protein